MFLWCSSLLLSIAWARRKNFLLCFAFIHLLLLMLREPSSFRALHFFAVRFSRGLLFNETIIRSLIKSSVTLSLNLLKLLHSSDNETPSVLVVVDTNNKILILYLSFNFWRWLLCVWDASLWDLFAVVSNWIYFNVIYYHWHSGAFISRKIDPTTTLYHWKFLKHFNSI